MNKPSFTLNSVKPEALEEFVTLAMIWSTETRHISSTTEIVNHRCYQRIIAMGEEVVPLLIVGLKRGEWFLCHALHKITGENPVPEDHRGKMEQVANDWISWGIRKGYVREVDLLPFGDVVSVDNDPRIVLSSTLSCPPKPRGRMVRFRGFVFGDIMSYNIIFHGQHHYQRPNLIVGGMPAVANESRDWKGMMKVDLVYLFSTEWKPHDGKFMDVFPDYLRWTHVPFEDREDIEVELPVASAVAVLESTKNILDAGGTVAYTCFGGYNRSGMFAALYSKALGLEDPVGLVQRARSGCLRNPKFVEFVNGFDYKFKP